jgi:hypothetical protein
MKITQSEINGEFKIVIKVSINGVDYTETGIIESGNFNELSKINMTIKSLQRLRESINSKQS